MSLTNWHEDDVACEVRWNMFWFAHVNQQKCASCNLSTRFLVLFGLFDTIGFDAAKEFVAVRWEEQFSAGRDLDATFFFSWTCFCHRNAADQAVTFGAAKKMKWLLLYKHNKWFHSSRVILHFVQMSAILCLMSMCLSWILCVQINSIKQPVKRNGFWKHVSLSDFFLLYSSWSLCRCFQTHTTNANLTTIFFCCKTTSETHTPRQYSMYVTQERNAS